MYDMLPVQPEIMMLWNPDDDFLFTDRPMAAEALWGYRKGIGWPPYIIQIVDKERVPLRRWRAVWGGQMGDQSPEAQRPRRLCLDLWTGANWLTVSTRELVPTGTRRARWTRIR